MRAVDLRRDPADHSELRPSPAWGRLLRTDDPAVVLAELGLCLVPRADELTLVSDDRPAEPLARWASAGRAGGLRVTRDVPGRPRWRLTLRAEADRAETALDRAVSLIAAWRGARAELLRLEHGTARRARELDMLQSLGRAAAEAATPFDLFASTLSVLQRGEDLDAAAAAYAEAGRAPRVALFLTRPLAERAIDTLAERAAAFLGWPAPLERDLHRLPSYDEARGQLAGLAEEDVLLLPLLRRSSPAGCLLAVAAAGPQTIDPRADGTAEERLRLLYNAANQLSVHLDRILTVREAEADRFRSIVDAMPQGVVFADSGLTVVSRNRSAARMLARAGEPSLCDLGLSHAARDVLDGKRALAEAEIRPSPAEVWSVTVSPLVQGGRAEGLVVVLADVTDSRRLQARLAQSEKMSSLGLMISGMAHELNNPLASIVGYAQLVRARGAADGETRRRLEAMARESDRCRKIVGNLLSFARERKPERRPLSLNQVVSDVVALLGYQMRVDGIAVETELAADVPAISGDAHQLQQVLVNLMTNARQAIRNHTPAGTGERTERGSIRLETTRDDDGHALLVVRDSGPGVAPELRSRIFDPFFTTKPPGEGTGLGLSLVYGAVTSHEGTIEVDAAEPSGALFRLRFPPAASIVEPAGPPPARPAACGCPSCEILVVDDDETVARVIREALEADGHHVRWAPDGPGALDLAARARFDLVITDVRMPGMDAEALVAELGRVHGLADRVLLTTGDVVGVCHEDLGRRLGAPVLFKPFDLEELRARVRAKLT
jgi:signal transduction histidine kinase/CheY-like chemotaxis protein